MALTCGFYNSIDHDRVYDATQFSAMFDGVIADGVFATYMKAFVVKVSTSDSREVIVQPGRAWFNHTWIYNDADLPMATPAPGVILDRIDALVFDINSDSEVRNNSIVWVQGEEASSNPQKPTLINTLSHHQYPLCYITRRAGVYEISASDIENCIGKAPCPFVTGLIDTIDITALMTQFESQFNTWFDGIKDSLDGDIAGHLQNEIDGLNSDVSSIQSALSNTYTPEISGLKQRMNTVENELTANNNRVYMDYHDGKYGINTSANRGADTFIPFKSTIEMDFSVSSHSNYSGSTDFQVPIGGVPRKFTMHAYVSASSGDWQSSGIITIIKNGETVFNSNRVYNNRYSTTEKEIPNIPTYNLTKDDILTVRVWAAGDQENVNGNEVMRYGTVRCNIILE